MENVFVQKILKIILVLTFWALLSGVSLYYLRMINSFGLLKWKKN